VEEDGNNIEESRKDSPKRKGGRKSKDKDSQNRGRSEEVSEDTSNEEETSIEAVAYKMDENRPLLKEESVDELMKDRQRIEEHRYPTHLCVPLSSMQHPTGISLVREVKTSLNTAYIFKNILT